MFYLLHWAFLGVVGRKSHAPVERQQSAQYIIPDNVQVSGTDKFLNTLYGCWFV